MYNQVLPSRDDCGNQLTFVPWMQFSTRDECNANRCVIDPSCPRCVTCSDGQYKSISATACSAKRTAAACGATEKFTTGSNSEKTRDDTTCTTCPDGHYKTSATACTAKKTQCGATEKFTAGANSEKTRDDTTCTVCGNGEFKDTSTSCKAKKTVCGTGEDAVAACLRRAPRLAHTTL
jgi:hypothetical protein